MELCENTLNVLRNFSGINQNIMIRSGNNIKTMSETRNMIATADVSEQFAKDFGIYDLNEFIGVMGLVDTPNLKFEDDFVVVSDSSGRSKVKYFYAAEETLTTATKDVKMPEADCKFVLDNDTLNKLKKAASTLGHNEVSIQAKDGVLSLSVVENQNQHQTLSLLISMVTLNRTLYLISSLVFLILRSYPVIMMLKYHLN